ncbi:uncharacterized protein [Heptranchias perlo]|uniref:uncharacterized protein n=1 Tax=Heptranchias perlo TaxID=212740 RepID=UPI003559EA96
MACAWRDVPAGTIAGCFRGARLDGGAGEPAAGVPQELFDRSGQTDAGAARGAKSEGPEPPCPTAAHALECLAGLRRFFESRGGSDGVYRKVYSLEDEVVQLAAGGPGDIAEWPRKSDARSDPGCLCAESDQLLRFEFPDHQVSALREMDKLRQEESFCDVTIVAEGLRFPAHRAVLAACSPFLRDRFRMDPSREVPVPPIAAGPEVLSRLLSSCYTGALDFPFKQVVSYLTAASCLQMGHVVERCRQSFSPAPPCRCRGFAGRPRCGRRRPERERASASPRWSRWLSGRARRRGRAGSR